MSSTIDDICDFADVCGHSSNVRLKEHTFISGYLRSKIANHTTETDHIPDVKNFTIIKSNYKNYKSIFLQGGGGGLFTRVQKPPLNKVCVIPPE